MKKQTGWFDGDVRPVYVGLYKRKYPEGIFYCRWDGKNFMYSHRDPIDAAKEKCPSPIQSLPWCGLAKRSSK